MNYWENIFISGASKIVTGEINIIKLCDAYCLFASSYKVNLIFSLVLRLTQVYHWR